MREIFADRAYKAGFDRGYFSFHSLRSGFLCSALLKAADRSEVEAALEHTALVAGWKVGGVCIAALCERSLHSVALWEWFGYG